MIVLAAFILGAAIGWRRAAKAGGSRADKLQYAMAHGLALCVPALLLTALISRLV
ncbi:hypothetical protein [Paracoccus sp. (in: a-proteobacteria)]|uniref:hypothetical protein n=1 Tax=Paracoccus sp. TaxID=267 RepID=UPI00322085B5